MKRTILCLVSVLIVGLIHFSEDSLAVTQESEDKELRALLTSRRDALRAIVLNQHARIQTGTEDLREYDEMVIEAMNVELELARTKEERIAIIEAILAGFVKREEYQEAKLNAGVGGTSVMLITKATRLKVEIELHKARKALGG
jgi:hypothetical protein